MRDDRQRLVDILDAIDRIDRHTGGGRQAFERDELVQIWVLRHLQLIGEAARRLSEEVRTQHPEIPWAAIVAPMCCHYGGLHESIGDRRAADSNRRNGHQPVPDRTNDFGG